VACKRQYSQKDVAEQVFGSQARFDTVANAEKVTLERVHLSKDTPLDSRRLAAYEHEKPLPVTRAQAAELKKLFTQPASYDFDTGAVKSCVINYGVVATFHSGERLIKVGVCFDCNWLGLFDGGDTAAPVKEEIDCDSIRKELVMLMKVAFPDDRDIQSLRETTHRSR
jgi:hypothetical protein